MEKKKLHMVNTDKMQEEKKIILITTRIIGIYKIHQSTYGKLLLI
jgi:hypothetical protein